MNTPENPTSESIDQAEWLAHGLLRRLDLLSGSGIHEDLSYSRNKLMSVIQNVGPVSIGNLSTAIGTAQSTTSEMVTRLEKRGLVAKSGNVYDGRVVKVDLTDTGRALLRRRRKRVREGYQLLVDRMLPAERDTFMGALRRLNELIRKGTE
jgi:DNA-binding MarR family transcriptional regulator